MFAAGDPFDDEAPAVCRGCGCTDAQACPGGCAWVEDPAGTGELCSACLIRMWNGEALPLDRWADAVASAGKGAVTRAQVAATPSARSSRLARPQEPGR